MFVYALAWCFRHTHVPNDYTRAPPLLPPAESPVGLLVGIGQGGGVMERRLCQSKVTATPPPCMLGYFSALVYCTRTTPSLQTRRERRDLAIPPTTPLFPHAKQEGRARLMPPEGTRHESRLIIWYTCWTAHRQPTVAYLFIWLHWLLKKKIQIIGDHYDIFHFHGTKISTYPHHPQLNAEALMLPLWTDSARLWKNVMRSSGFQDAPQHCYNEESYLYFFLVSGHSMKIKHMWK